MRIRVLFVISAVIVGCVFHAPLCAQTISGPTSQPAVERQPSSTAVPGVAPPPAARAEGAATRDTVVQPGPFERFFTQAELVLKSLAYLVGAAWVYFNFFRGRTYRPRLETKVICERLGTDAPVLLRVVASAKNAGLSKVDLADKGSGVVISGYTLASRTWEELQGHPILTPHHKWIEPGETVVDEVIVQLDASYPAFQVELWLNSTSKLTWVARTIIGPAERNDRVGTTANSTAAARAGTETRAAGTTAAATGEAGHRPGRAFEAADPRAGSTATTAATG